MDTPALTHDDPSPAQRRIDAWVVSIAALVVVVSIGLPLVGLRVFLGTDGVFQLAPWRDAASSAVHTTNPILGDTYDAVFPAHAELRRRITTGDFPLWTRYLSGGAPLAAIPDGGLLSPLSLPYLVLPLWYAPAAAKLLEMLVALGFSFLFLRRIGVGRAAAVVGGLVYMNSGFQAVWTNWPQSHVGAMIPALFWATERALTMKKARELVVVALVVAAMFLEGFPAVTAYALAGAAAYCVFRIVARYREPLRGRISGLLMVGSGVLLGTGVAAFQLIPFVFRLSDLNLGYRSFIGPLPWFAAGTVVVPNLLGSPVAGNWYAPSNYVELQSFLGAAAVVLVVAGLLRTRARRGVAAGAPAFLYAGIAVSGVVLFAGGPFTHLAELIPVLATSPIGRLRSMFGFFLAMAAGIGFSALTETEPDGRRRRRELAVWAAIVVVALVAAVHTLSVLRGNPAHEYVVRQSILPAVSFICALVLIVGSLRSARTGRAGVFAVPVLIAAESLAFVLPFWPRIPRAEFYPTTSAHTFLQKNLGSERLAASEFTLYPGTTLFYRINSVTSHSFQYPEWKDLMSGIDPAAFRLSPTFAVLSPDERVATSPILDRLSARFFAVDPADAIIGRQVPAGPSSGRIPLAPAKPLTAPVAASDVRGVTLIVADQAPSARRPLASAELLDAGGTVVGRGTRRVPMTLPSNELWIPIAQRPGTRPVAVRLLIDGAASGITLRSDANGRPIVAPVVGTSDGLRVAFAGPAVLYERLRALPRIRWADKARVVAQPLRRIRDLSAGVPADTVILSRPAPSASGRPASLRVTHDDQDEIRVRVDAAGNGYLVFADELQHGWRATVDHRRVDVLPADHALAAVSVPSGRHDVEVQYDPSGIAAGDVVTLLSIAAAAGTVLVSSRRRQRRR
jgi:hypothetical protein